jgi:hypothetical protein
VGCHEKNNEPLVSITYKKYVGQLSDYCLNKRTVLHRVKRDTVLQQDSADYVLQCNHL